MRWLKGDSIKKIILIASEQGGLCIVCCWSGIIPTKNDDFTVFREGGGVILMIYSIT
jgi:hypothetical protein